MRSRSGSGGRRSTFPLEALLPEDADQSQEAGDLLQVQNCGVVQLDDGQRLLVVGTAVLRQPDGETPLNPPEPPPQNLQLLTVPLHRERPDVPSHTSF